MSRHLDDSYWLTAAAVCTDKEFHAIVFRDMLNLGTRRIAHNLGISRAAVRERLENADRKISATLEKEAA